MLPAWALLLLAIAACVPCARAIDLSFNVQMKASPQREDQYCERFFAVPAEFRGMHVVGFEPLPGSAAHHMILYWCPQEARPSQAAEDCTSHERGPGCVNFAYVWAQNGVPLFFPPHVGIPLGSQGGANSFVLQVHYGFAVPAGFTDTSGVRLIVSNKRDAAWRMPRVILLAPAGGFTLQPGESEIVLGPLTQRNTLSEPLSLFAVRTHAHIRGLWNDVKVRRGQNVLWTFQRSTRLVQSFAPLDEAFRVMPGDELEFRCAYDTTREARAVREGSTKHDEMCNVVRSCSLWQRPPRRCRQPACVLTRAHTRLPAVPVRLPRARASVADSLARSVGV